VKSRWSGAIGHGARASYDELAAAYGELADWIAERGEEPAGDPWEVYHSDPAKEPDPERWRTEIVMPVRA
jgi:effector-binding domain-containing protein